MARFSWSLGLAFSLTAAVLFPEFAAQAQSPAVVLSQLLSSPHALPNMPPNGAWGEVINATNRWIVIQNHAGQQFPIAIEDIGQFLIRWPTSIDALTVASLVEAYGFDIGSNTLETAHIDVYEGEDQILVRPGYDRTLPGNVNLPTISPVYAQIYNSIMSTWGYPGQLTLYGWAYPVAPGGGGGLPVRAHIVGAAIDRVPLRIALPGNNAATIIAGRNEAFTITQVTRGEPRFARKGDYAFLMPAGVKPSGIVVSQLVLYKKIPRRMFDARK